jgi:hypothetical protein
LSLQIEAVQVSESLPEERPLTLREAADRYGFTVSTLRAEAGRGRLSIFRIGKRDYTMAADVQEMIRRCREDDPRRDSILTRKGSIGLSETDRVSSAQERAKESVAKLKKHCTNTLA